MFRVEILNRNLPIWVSTDLNDETSSRIDNNYFHASYVVSTEKIRTLLRYNFSVRPLSEMVNEILSGVRGYEEGEIPVLEGIYVMPNCIFPVFEKFTEELEDEKYFLERKDILLTKHGSCGAVGFISSTFFENFPHATAGTEVFIIRLKEEYLKSSAYISCFLNSTYGQGLLRRYIAGSVSPTLRKEDLEEIIIPLPRDESIIQECEQWLEDLQRQVLEGTDFIKPSEETIRTLGQVPRLSRLPTNWYSGVGRDPHGFHRQTEDSEITDQSILKSDLPIWVSGELPEDRIDNNYSHPAYQTAIDWINSLSLPIKTIGELKENIFVGETPKEEGEIPVIEGRNIKPNCLFPDFQKYTDNEDIALQEYDIVIVRSGTSGLAALILPRILKNIGQLAVSDHIHVLRLREEYKQCAPFICVFLNSKIGQALIRRYVGGSISPTLNRRDLVNIPIPLPQNNEILERSEEFLNTLQENFLQYSRFVSPSDRLLEILGLTESLPKLPVNWMPGGKRDPHGYYER